MIKFTFNKTALNQTRESLKQALNANTITFNDYCSEVKRLMKFAAELSVDVVESA